MKYCSSCSEPAQNTMVMCVKCGAKNFSDMPNGPLQNKTSADQNQSEITAAKPVPNIQSNMALHGGVPTGWLSSPPTPWRRYAARSIDIVVFGYLGFTIIGFVFYSVAPYTADQFFSIFSSPGGILIDIVVTALIGCVLGGVVIGLSGSSLGKLIFGLMVVDQNGRRIGAVQGIQRDLSVYLRGLGLGIPLVSLITLWMSYSKLKDTGATSWDSEKNYTVWHRPSGPGQYTLNILGILLLITVTAAGRIMNSI